MPSTNYLLRLTKIVSVSGVGLMAFLIAFGNITDYYSNYDFVQHVLAMDTIFASSKLQYRSLHAPAVSHIAYILLIASECFMAFACLKGGWILYRNILSGAAAFHAKKNWSVAGLLSGILIWFVGFEVIGGEWFAMWQSNSWNGLASASRILEFLFGLLILLHLSEPEL